MNKKTLSKKTIANLMNSYRIINMQKKFYGIKKNIIKKYTFK